MSIRPVKRMVKSKLTLEGAGVHLRRAFGFGDTSQFDPFLLLDDFRNDLPNDYVAGFPWHPQIGDPTVADGILDRLVHNAHRIEMRGDSMRKNRGKPNT